MKQLTRMAWAVSAALCAGTALAALAVRESADTFKIVRSGNIVVDAITVDRGDLDESDVKRSHVVLADGTAVWNRWSETADRTFRLEVASHTNGTVEITFAGQVAFDSAHRRRGIRLDIPKKVLGEASYSSVKEYGNSYREEHGRFGADFTGLVSRWLAVDGLVFDFNPVGPGDDYAFGRGSGWRYMDTYSGVWDVKRTPHGFSVENGADVLTTWGGFFGTKLVIREGSFDDYHVSHPLKAFGYSFDFAPLRLLAFGAPKFGGAYAKGDVQFSTVRGYGWVEDDPWERKPAIGHDEGAYYSALTGDKRETYRFSGLPAGTYLFTFAAGNYAAVSNRFDVTLNGEPFLSAAEIAPRTRRRIVKALHISGGKLDVELSGKWLLSVLGLQALLSDTEDFTFTRKPWVTDGYEPGLLQSNADITSPVALSSRDETEELPVPGTEFASPPREVSPEVCLPDPLAPELAWTHDARIFRLFNNSSMMNELDRPGALKEYLDRELAGKNINAIMLSGMLSRHTFIGAHRNRGLAAVRRVVGEAHRRGIKVIDHFDATLLWNAGHGFRVLAEKIPELNISKNDGLPGFQLCIMNPSFREWFMRYVEDDAKTGVDGMQLDEVQFWWHGCICPHCRSAFRRDTGWEVPLNEADAAWRSDSSPFMKRWFTWRARQATDFLIEVRRRVKSINPHLVLSAYSTPWGYTYPFGEMRLGRDYIDLARTVNFFGMEVMSRCVMKGVRAELPLRRSQNPVMLAYGTPMWDWYYNADWQNDYVAWALSAMTGHSPLLAEVDRGPDVPDYPRFGASPLAMDKRGAHPVAEVALLFSSDSRDWNVRAVKMRDDLFGTAQAMEARHIPYEVIGQMSLDEKHLSKYKVLFVGSAHCLSDASIAAIRKFAERGGTVRMSALAGLCDVLGDQRKVWPFKDVFGFDPWIDRDDGRIRTARLGSGVLLYSPAPKGERFNMPEITSPYPYRYDPDPAAEREFWDETARWAAPGAWWKTDAPHNVYTSLWRERDGTLAIHFLNATGVRNTPGENLTPQAPQPAFPAIAHDITFTVPEGAGAWAVSPDFDGKRELAATRNANGSLTVTLPASCLKTYALVRVRFNPD